MKHHSERPRDLMDTTDDHKGEDFQSDQLSSLCDVYEEVMKNRIQQNEQVGLKEAGGGGGRRWEGGGGERKQNKHRKCMLIGRYL